MTTSPQETTLLDSMSFLRSTLNALSAHIAILDEHGTIIEVNAAWNRFAGENELSSDQCGLGTNYLRVCDSACGNSSEGASVVADGILMLDEYGRRTLQNQRMIDLLDVQSTEEATTATFLVPLEN